MIQTLLTAAGTTAPTLTLVVASAKGDFGWYEVRSPGRGNLAYATLAQGGE